MTGDTLAHMGEVTERVETLIRGLVAGNSAGYRMPSERMMARTFGVSRTTVRLVLTKIIAEGKIRADQGRGYVVLPRNGETSTEQ